MSLSREISNISQFVTGTVENLVVSSPSCDTILFSFYPTPDVIRSHDQKNNFSKYCSKMADREIN